MKLQFRFWECDVWAWAGLVCDGMVLLLVHDEPIAMDVCQITSIFVGIDGICRVHKPGVPNGPASLQYLAQHAAQRQRASGPA